MTISHRPGKLYNNADALSRIALPNTPDNQAWEEEDNNRDIPVMGISLCELSDESFKQMEATYEANLNTDKLLQILSAKEIEPGLESTLDE